MSQILLQRATASVGVGHAQRRPVPSSNCFTAAAIVLGLSCTRTIGLRAPNSRQQCHPSSYVPRSTDADVGLLSNADDEDDLEAIGLGSGSGAFDESQLGSLPEVRYQPAMPMKVRKVWRAKAETMAKEKRLINIQVGQLGITPAFLRACADILQKHSLVRVKLGDGSGLERRTAAQLLEKYLDCVCVHQVGFTVTLYRESGLPRPSNTVSDGDSAAAEAAAFNHAAAAAERKKAAEEEKAARKRAGQQSPQQRPPEFSVL